MTAAGLNIKIRLWDINTPTDNEVGGAVVTGTAVGIFPARMQEQPINQLLLQQGLETDKFFSVVAVIPPSYYGYLLDRNEIDVYAPTDHFYYGKRFRIKSSRPSDFNPRDPRNYVMLTVSRSTVSHERQ